jgi:hypothetical protein
MLQIVVILPSKRASHWYYVVLRERRGKRFPRTGTNLPLCAKRVPKVLRTDGQQVQQNQAFAISSSLGKRRAAPLSLDVFRRTAELAQRWRYTKVAQGTPSGVGQGTATGLWQPAKRS